jgi:hypothetical protein
MGQRLGNAVQEGFGTNETVVGQQVGAKSHVLAAAEADLEMERARVAEEALGGDRALFGHFDLRQEVFEELLLSFPQRPPLAAAVEPVERGRVAGFVRGHEAAR